MRIGLLHFTAPPIVGGVEAILGRQAAALAARGHDLLVLAGRGRAGGRGVAFRRLSALDSKYPPLASINARMAQGMGLPPEFAALSVEIESALLPILSELDVCVVHNALTLHFNLPLTAALHRLASAARAPGLVAWCHDLAWTNPLYRSVVREAYPWTLLKQPFPYTSYVVVSEDRRAELARVTGLDRQRIAVIPAGVDVDHALALGAPARRLLNEFKLLEAEPFILLPVRITRRKNIEYAVRMVAALRARGWQPKLLVTGPPGPHDPASLRYMHELQALIAELHLEREVILLQAGPSPAGRRWRPSDGMMGALYRAADLVVIPSAQEGFGIPVLEAAAVGLQIFCSDIPAFRETAGDRVAYFQLEDPPADLADRIAAFLEVDGRYGLRKRVQRSFDWDEIFDEQVLPLLTAAARPASVSQDQAHAGLLALGTPMTPSKQVAPAGRLVSSATSAQTPAGLAGSSEASSG